MFSTFIHRKLFVGTLSSFLLMWAWFVLLPPKPVYACLPVGRFDYTVAERTADAELVIKGTVINNSYELPANKEISGDSGSMGAASRTVGGSYMATIIVEQYLKGEGPAIVDVVGYSWGNGDCLSSAFPTSHLIFFVNGDPNQVMTANYLGVYSATEAATAVNIQDAIEASGQQPFRPTYTIKQGLILILSKIWWFFPCSIPILFIGLIWFAIRRWRRAKLAKPASAEQFDLEKD